jgi:flagellar protein FliO/FliZ
MLLANQNEFKSLNKAKLIKFYKITIRVISMYWVSTLATADISSDSFSELSSEADNSEVSNDVTPSVVATEQLPLTLASTLVPSQKIVSPKLPDTSDQLIQVTLALALVVGLIYGAAWLFKRTKGLAPSSGIPMKTLSVLPMGVKEKIILVEVGGKQLLLGMTPHQINTLATFDEPIIDTTLGNDKPFSSRLKEMLNNNQKQNKDTGLNE